MSELLSNYRKINRFRVAFSDIDMLRHANNLSYMRWAEQTRTEYFADVLGEDIFGRQGMIMATMTTDFKGPVLYREHVAVGCRVSRIGTKSFDVAHDVISEDRGLLAARIISTLVAFDYDANKTIAVPALWREVIAAFEPSPPE